MATSVSDRAPLLRDTLEQRLRYIDITFECLERARRIVNRVDGREGPKFPDELPTARSARLGRIMGRLRAKQCAREGIACRHEPSAEHALPTASGSTCPPIGKAA